MKSAGQPQPGLEVDYREEQPGLEVVPQEQNQWNSPQFDHDWRGSKMLAVDQFDLQHHKLVVLPDDRHPDEKFAHAQARQLDATAPAAVGTAHGLKEGPENQRRRRPWTRRKRVWLLLGALGLILIVVSIALGAILTNKDSNIVPSDQPETSTRPGPPTPSSPSPSVMPTNSLQSIRPGSALSVTGWRKSDGAVGMMLFYQGPDDELRASRYDSSSSASSSSSSLWGPSSKLMLDATGKENTRLAGTAIQYETKYAPQVELFYTGARSRFYGGNINDRYTPPTNADSVNRLKLSTGPNSSVAAYWPWIVFQSSDGSGDMVRLRSRLHPGLAPAAEWDQTDISIQAMVGSKLAAVPLSSNYSRSSQRGGLAIFYQNSDDKLAVVVPESDANDAPPVSLPFGGLPGNVKMPKGGPIAAFSVAREEDDESRVDVHVLVRDASEKNEIKVLSSVGRWARWEDTSDRLATALKGIRLDSASDIACLTMASTNRDENNLEVGLKGINDGAEARCFFQRAGGHVVDVRFDGETWEVVGDVDLS